MSCIKKLDRREKEEVSKGGRAGGRSGLYQSGLSTVEWTVTHWIGNCDLRREREKSSDLLSSSRVLVVSSGTTTNWEQQEQHVLTTLRAKKGNKLLWTIREWVGLDASGTNNTCGDNERIYWLDKTCIRDKLDINFKKVVMQNISKYRTLLLRNIEQ